MYNTIKEKFLEKPLFVGLFLFLTALIPHAVIAIRMNMPFISTDEIGVVGSAAWFVGEDWSEVIKRISYYGYGQALLYIPVFMITDNPLLRYKLMGIENAFLVAMMPVIVYYISIKYLKIEKGLSLVIALCIGLFPSYTSYTKWLWNEVSLLVLPWLVILVMFKLYNSEVKREKNLYSILLGFILIYSYSVHGRALGIIISVLVIIFLFHLIYKKSNINYILFFLSIAVTSILYSIIKKELVNNLWLAEGKVLNNTSSMIIPKITNFLSYDNIQYKILGIIGHIYGAIISTYGLLVVFIIMFLILLIRYGVKKLNKNELLLYSYSFLLLVFSFSIGVVFLSDAFVGNPRRGDYLIYIRYSSIAFGLILYSSILMFIKYKSFFSNKIFFISLLITIIVSMIVMFFLETIINKQPIAAPSIMNIIPFSASNKIGYIDIINFKVLSIISILIFVLFYYLMKYGKYKVGLLFLILVFIYVYAFNVVRIIVPSNDEYYNKVKNWQQVLGNIDSRDIKIDIYYCDKENKKPFSDTLLQYAIPKSKVHIVNNVEKLYPNSIVVSTSDFRLDYIYKDVYRVLDNSLKGNEYIWFVGDDINEKLKEKYHFNTQNNYGKEIIYKFDFNILNGVKKDNQIVSNGKEGYLVYGPYITLNNGIYNINIKGKLLSGNFSEKSYFDIVYNAGKNVIKREYNLSKYVKNGNIEIDEIFRIENTLSNIEFRVYLNKNVLCSIENAVLTEKGE